MTAKLPFIALLTTVLVFAGEFRTMLNKAETVTLEVPRPAEAVLTVKTLELKVGPAQAPPNRVQQLGQFIQQDLSKQFDISNKKPDATLNFSVIAYEPVKISSQTTTEMRSINVGNDKTPNYVDRSVPVVYELIHGSATIGVVVVDVSGRTVDTFQENEVIARRKELTVNGQASTQGETPSATNLAKTTPPNSLSGMFNFRLHIPHQATEPAATPCG